jgi:Putative phage serine protease XkdF
MFTDLPIYRLLISEDLEAAEQIEYVSLVQSPAIEKNFLAFSQRAAFSTDDDRRIITGPAMLADTPIFRSDGRGAYYVIFDKSNVLKAAQKFFRKGYVNKVNLAHDSGQTPEGVYFFESWITDSNRGILPPKGFEDAPEGSWFLSAKVDNQAVWGGVKDGTYKGFSVEGIFGLELQREAPSGPVLENIIEEIRKIVQNAGF